MNAKDRWLAYPRQCGIAIDQAINALIPPFITLSFADETMSARTYRGSRDGKIVGTFLMPIFDWMFSWQATDPEILEDDGVTPIKGHCHRAYIKEILRRNEPPEYREAAGKLKP